MKCHSLKPHPKGILMLLNTNFKYKHLNLKVQVPSFRHRNHHLPSQDNSRDSQPSESKFIKLSSFSSVTPWFPAFRCIPCCPGLTNGPIWIKKYRVCVQTMLFKLQFICHLSVLLIQIGSGMMFTKAMLFSVPSQLRSVDWPPPRAATKSGKCASHSDPIMDATGVSFPDPSKVESKEG